MTFLVDLQPLTGPSPYGQLPVLERLGPAQAEQAFAVLAERALTIIQKAALAGCTSCPGPVLAALGREAVDQVATEPQWWLVVLALAGNRSTEPDTLDRIAAAATRLPEVRAAVARSLNASAATLDALGSDPDAGVRREVAGSAGASEETLSRLVQDTDRQVQLTALRNPRTGVPHVLGALQGVPDLQTIRAAAAHPGLPEVVARELAAHHAPTVRAAVAANPALPPDELAGLAMQGDRRIQAGVAAHPRLPGSVALALTSTANPVSTRLALAENRNLPALAATHLLVDPNPAVRRKVALSSAALGVTAVRLAAAEEDDPRVLGALVSHRLLTEQVRVAMFTRTPSSALRAVGRALVFSDQPIPAELARLIAAGGDPKTLAGLVMRAECPLTLFEVAVSSADPALRCAAAANPECPAHLLEVLAGDLDPLVRALARSHPEIGQP
jgi:hypothetical protein